MREGGGEGTSLHQVLWAVENKNLKVSFLPHLYILYVSLGHILDMNGTENRKQLHQHKMSINNENM